LKIDIERIDGYLRRLQDAACQVQAQLVLPILAEAMFDTWSTEKCIYICGNGGSAGNAIHLANDLIYGAGMTNGRGLRAEALSANAAVLTCLANDTGYENIYSEQLRVKGAEGDILIALSGSGNSPNIVRAIETAKDIGIKTFAILGYSGGKCKEIADHPIHFEVDDMQIAEDLQLIVGHICMQWLSEQKI
jgi:D-sedoheptulose 7-phosphate isomerase